MKFIHNLNNEISFDFVKKIKIKIGQSCFQANEKLFLYLHGYCIYI